MFLTWGELLSISLLGDYVYACVGERGFAAISLSEGLGAWVAREAPSSGHDSAAAPIGSVFV